MATRALREGQHYFKRRGRVMFSWPAMCRWVKERGSLAAQALSRWYGVAGVGVRGKHGRLFLDFRWRGVRCREFTELTDTSENRRRCAAFLKIIQGEITLGTFDYRRHFPNGTRLATFYPEVARSGTTVASFLATWHARRSPFRPDGTVVEVAELHPSTWQHDGSLIERRLVPALGAIRLTELRIGRCRDYRRELEVEGLSGKTVTNILGLLHKAMADAVEEGLLLVNPVPRLARRTRRAQGMRSNSDPLALEEVKAFLETVPALYRDLYLVWFRTGWRHPRFWPCGSTGSTSTDRP